MDSLRATRYSARVRGEGQGSARPGDGARRAIAGAVVLVLVLLGAALALATRGEPMPAPAFDETRDLLAVPAPADNGWTVIAASADVFYGDVLGPRTHDVGLLLGVASGPPDLAALEALGPDLEALELSEEAVRAVDEALARPRYVLDCPLDLTAPPCRTMASVGAHRVAAALALRESRQGWHEEALERAERLLAADHDALRGSRSALNAMVAAANAREAIELTALLAASIAADEAPVDPEVRARLDSLELALVSLDPARWSLERPIAAEAILVRRAIETIDGEAAGAPGGALATPFFDRGRTARVFDEHFQAMIEHARDPDGVPAPAPPGGASFFDPVGKLVIDTLTFDLGGLVTAYAERAGEAEHRIAAARVAIAAARASAEAAAAAEAPPD